LRDQWWSGELEANAGVDEGERLADDGGRVRGVVGWRVGHSLDGLRDHVPETAQVYLAVGPGHPGDQLEQLRGDNGRWAEVDRRAATWALRWSRWDPVSAILDISWKKGS
jgi:hypothetical protein